MNRLRSLLRLEDKLAAEERRLATLGDGPPRRSAAIALAGAILAHAAILLLPTLRSSATLPPSSPAPDFPRVWRFSPAGTGSFVEIAGGGAPDATSKASRDTGAEPVPEPAPELSAGGSPSDLDALIPSPFDAPPPVFDPGPVTGLEPEPTPALLTRVPPVYPPAARALRASGRVTVHLDVFPDGSVGNASVLECSRPRLGFEAAALEAVRQWRYAADPSRSAARPLVVTIEFKRQDTSP